MTFNGHRRKGKGCVLLLLSGCICLSPCIMKHCLQVFNSKLYQPNSLITQESFQCSNNTHFNDFFVLFLRLFCESWFISKWKLSNSSTNLNDSRRKGTALRITHVAEEVLRDGFLRAQSWDSPLPGQFPCPSSQLGELYFNITLNFQKHLKNSP